MHQSKPSVLALRVLKRAALVAAKDHAGVVQAHFFVKHKTQSTTLA
jgi:hypothetical protein